MDDLLVGVQSGENLDEIIREIDTGLKQANFIIKKWIKTGDVLQQQENVMSVTDQENVMSVTDTISDHPMVDVSLTSKGPLPPLGGRPKQSTDASFKQNDYDKQGGCVKQDGYTPYLSYDYLPSTDKFKVRVSLNYSKKKRGIRTKEDFQNIHELAECVQT